MPLIVKEVIDQVVKEASKDIALLAQEWGMTVKRVGRHHSTLCPFHDDKNPSLSLLDNGYFCHSCGAKGTVIRLGMRQTGLPFPDVVRQLATRYNITIVETEEEREERLLQEQVTDVLASAANWYSNQLRLSPFALSYLKDERSLSDEVIQDWQLGFAPSGGCVDYLLGRYPMNLVQQAGLVSSGEYGRRDFFRDRLMIPIVAGGRVVGFGGRALYEYQKAKYKNSPETIAFKKDQILFGFDRARFAIQQQQEAVLVEGYFDVIAAHRNGMTNTVAALGTAVGEKQIRKLLRLTTNLSAAFDRDKAGAMAADRAFSSLEPLSYAGKINLSVLELKEHDLDDHFKVCHDRPSSVPWLNWKYYQLISGVNLSDPAQFQGVVAQVSSHLGKITSLTTRSFYIRYCAQELSGGDRAYADQLEKDLRRSLFKKQDSQGYMSSEFLAASHLLWIYLNHPDCRPQIALWVIARDYTWKIPEHRKLWQLIQDLEEEEESQDLAISVSHCAPKPLLDLAKPEVDIESSLAASFDCLAREQVSDAKRFLLRRWIQERNPIVVDINQGV